MDAKAGKTRGEDEKSKLKRGFKSPEFGVVVLAVLSLVVLLNPFSEEVLAVAPALPFLASFALFMVPGLVLSLVFLPGPDFAGPARVPLAFALSVGLFGLPALPALILGSRPAMYLTICAAIFNLFLALAVVRVLRKRVPEEDGGRPTGDPSTGLLWVPFLLLAGMLAWISAENVPRPAADIWIFLSRVRDFLEFGGRHGADDSFSRLDINGWLPEQATLSLISGLDPATQVLWYLAPALVVVALLALYALVRTLLENEKAALAITSLAALFFLVSFGSPSLNSVLAPGGEFVQYITEDKFVARYIFLPVALSLAILFMRDRSWRSLGLFAFVCLSVAVVHPLGLVFIGIPIAGFGLVHLVINQRDRRAWRGVGGLWLVLLVLIGPPALYLLATGDPLLARQEAADPGTAANLIATWQYERRLLEIWEGSFVAHPSLLLDPAMVAAYLLGLPFLIWKARDSLAAQLLLGVLAFVPVLIFVPYVATYISTVIGPWLLYRLTWPLLLAALLTLGWMCWEVLRFVGSGLSGFGPTRRVAPFLPLIIIGLFLVEAIPAALTSLRAVDTSDKSAQNESSCVDPTFRWMEDTLRDRGAVGVMAPRAESSCIVAFSTSANVLGIRGQIPSEAEQDLKDFYSTPTLGSGNIEILQRHRVGYVMLPVDSPLNVQLEHLPGFARVNNPGEKYRVYEVDQSALGPTPRVVANDELNNEEWDPAIEAYTKALENNPDEDDRFLAYLGLGRAYLGKEQYAESAKSYEAALEVDPESSAAHDLLANAYNAAGEKDQARTEFERAIELDPENTDLRLRYGQFLVSSDRREAVEQHRVVVEMFPKVPDYRVKLGAALLVAGAPEVADEQFERAVYLAPLSAGVWADVGGANLLSGRPEKALEYYDGALKLDPNSQLYALNLGKVHAQLSTLNGRDEAHFEEAESLLESVDELGRRPREPDQREAAKIALGDLYLKWDRPEDAAVAYERALDLNPDSEVARQKMDGLG